VYSGVSTNKTDHQDITEILLKVALNTITSGMVFASLSVGSFTLNVYLFFKLFIYL
jgi:hypothetical protein